MVKILSSFFFLLLCEILFIFPGGIVFEILRTTIPALNENAIYLIAFLFSALCLFLCLKVFFPEIFLKIIGLLEVNRFSIYLLITLFFLAGLLYSIIVILGIKLGLVGPKTSIEDTSLVNLILLSLAALFCSAVEEIFFRGAALSFILRRVKPWASILLISTVFSLGHLQYTGIILYLSAFIFSVLAAILVIKTKSLYGAIGLHCGWNFAYSMFNLYFDFSIKPIPNWGSTFEVLEIGVFLVILFSVIVWSYQPFFGNRPTNISTC